MNDNLVHELTNARPIDLIRERVEALAETAHQWATEVDYIKDEEQARRADDFLTQITKELQAVARQVKEEQTPHRLAIDAIKVSYGPLTLVLERAKTLISGKAFGWLQSQRRVAEEAKRQREAAAQRLAAEAEKAAEAAALQIYDGGDVIGRVTRAAELAAQADAAAREAAAPSPRPQMRGQYSGRARTLVTTWHAEVTDVLLCFVHYQDRSDVRDVLAKLASAEARGGARQIPGCRVYPTESPR